MKISFTVSGEPIAKARPRVFFNKHLGRAMAYTPKKTMGYEEHIRCCVPPGRFEGPIVITIRAYRSIPKSKSNKFKALAESGEIRPVVKPDCDNFAKSCLDALNKITFNDDSQVVSLLVQKYYSTEPRTEIEIEDL